MDIQLKKRPWYVRYRAHLIAAGLFAAFGIYVFSRSMGPKRLKVNAESLYITEVKEEKFMEYVEAEATVQPIITLQVNSLEEGNIVHIAQEEGAMVKKGDTLLVLSSPSLEREIEELHDALEKQYMAYAEQELEMQQKRITLQQQMLNNTYEQERLRRQNLLDHEEFRMGTRSKAQLEMSDSEYKYKKETARLARESLKHDSALAVVRSKLMNTNRTRETKKYERARSRLDHLIIVAPTDGQISYTDLVLGQRIGAETKVADIKVMSDYKLQTNINEYYVDRIVSGLPATALNHGEQYPLRVSKVVPEVKERTFQINLTFSGEKPQNLRIGKSLRVQVQLGQPETAVVIPKGDFFAVTGGQWIFRFTKDGKRAVRVPIKVARQNPNQYEVTQGLNPGDRIIVSGYTMFGETEEIIF